MIITYPNTLFHTLRACLFFEKRFSVTSAELNLTDGWLRLNFLWWKKKQRPYENENNSSSSTSSSLSSFKMEIHFGTGGLPEKTIMGIKWCHIVLLEYSIKCGYDQKVMGFSSWIEYTLRREKLFVFLNFVSQIAGPFFSYGSQISTEFDAFFCYTFPSS